VIAVQPKFRWFGRSTRPNPTKKIGDYIARAEAKGEIPLMATLRHHGITCGPTYTGGGRAEDERFRAWYRMLANAIGNHRVVIGYEPDSLGTIDCLKKSRRDDRVATLKYGLDLLAALPNATVYIEAGASDWESPKRTASLLRRIGIHKVRGFMLNATHYDWTGNNIAYGRQVSRLTGGKHFIINTSGNGRGPVHYQQWKSVAAQKRRRGWHRVNVWCNAKMRGLGIAPTTKTHDPLVDAYMWINRPGVSSGTCNGGKKKTNVGEWFQARANMWVRYRTDWIRPPRGTRHGHFSRPSLRKVAGSRAVGPIKRPY
jgi:endoglucanase